MNFEEYDASIDEDHFCMASVRIPAKGIEEIEGIHYTGKLKYLGIKCLTKEE